MYPLCRCIRQSGKYKEASFSTAQIIEHEKHLYKKEERMSIKQLEELEQKYFQNISVYGTSNGVDENIEKLQQMKSALRYIEPELNN